MNYFTVIGSRGIRTTDIKDFVETAQRIHNTGKALFRSGHAMGCDYLAEVALALNGATFDEKHEIYLPYAGFNKGDSETTPWHIDASQLPNYEEATTMTREAVPFFAKLTDFGRQAYIRNTYQVLGQDLRTPSQAVVCWAEWRDEQHRWVKGGTSAAVNLARQHNIPVINLIDGEPAYDVLESILSDLR